MTTFLKSLVAAAAMTISPLAVAPVAADNLISPQVQDVLDYINAHGVSVIHTSDGGALVVIETDFATRRVPEMRLALGRDGVAMPATDLGTLRKITGLQVFKAPASVNISDYDQLIILDADASATLGAAPLG